MYKLSNIAVLADAMVHDAEARLRDAGEPRLRVLEGGPLHEMYAAATAAAAAGDAEPKQEL